MDNQKVNNSKRKLLASAGAIGLGGLVPNSAIGQSAGSENMPPNIPKWMKSLGEPVNWRPYGLPSEFEKHVVKFKRPSDQPTEGVSLTPLQDLHGTITPSGLIFERQHGGVPIIDPSQQRLMVHGMVKRPLLLDMNDIVRLPSISRVYFLECSGNTSRDWAKPVSKNVQQTHGLLSNCEWTGVLLSTLLDEVGVDPKATWILAEGSDASAHTRSLPIGKCFEDAMLVYAQNGEMLRPEQGYPLRLIIPGWEGNVSVKWLRRLKVSDAPFYTRQETSRYTDLMPDGKAREFTFVMEAKSVITKPSGGQKLLKHGFNEISGLAWSGNGRVQRVDVSTDAGKTWREARIDGPVQTRAVVRFTYPWSWNGGPAILQSRAVDETGYVQPTRSQIISLRGINSRYHYNAIQSWGVNSNGEVSNVQV